MSGPGRPLGAVVTLALGRLRKDAVLFGESQSRVVLSAKPVHRQAILDCARHAGVPVAVIGSVAGDRLVVSLEGEGAAAKAIDVPVASLYDRWAFSIERTLHQT
jgi:phosphoribosylformylglycinamidine synthase